MAGTAMLNTVNMGCGLDLAVVKANLLRPVGPIVGFISQFALMPMVSFKLINSSFFWIE